MRENPWLEWTRTRLQPQERKDLLSALTTEQKAQLVQQDHVWVEKVGVLWKALDGDLRRTRFTHGTDFRTSRGEFHMDSQGRSHRIENRGRPRSPDPASDKPVTHRITAAAKGNAVDASTGTRFEGRGHLISHEGDVLAVHE